MPIQLENLQQPCAEEMKDLVKIYQDTLNQPDQAVETWVNERLKQGLQLFTGRFNSRLLVAIWTNHTEHGWELEQLCVRAITRRRGVARQLLQLLIKQAHSQNITLYINDPVPPELPPLLKELNFQHHESQWQQLPPINES